MRPSRQKAIALVGMGYVGLSTAVCFANRGFTVLGVDVDQSRMNTLNKGLSPIHEKSIEPLLRTALRKKTISFSTKYDGLPNSRTIFITVGTPSKADGGIDTEYVEAASKQVGKQLSRSRGYHLVVVKSTVTPGTTEGLVRPILERESEKKAGVDFGLASNPEFLHEGSAIDETFHPDAVVIGGYDTKSSKTLMSMYESFYGRSQPPIILTTPSNAEMMKYAINGVRASQVSFVNTIADICSGIPGCDMDEVRKGLSLVAKLDERYLGAGLGFGGSCVPPHTRVVTESGFRPISAVRTGDKVLSHDGRYHRVIQTYSREYIGMMYLFRSQGFSTTPLMVTPNHPILCSLRNMGGRQRFYTTGAQGRGVVQKLNNLYLIEPPRFADPSYISQGDFMVLPSFNENSLEIPVLLMASARRHYRLALCPDLMYLFGLWLAEGIVDTKTGEVLFSLNTNETEFLRELDWITRRYFGVRTRMKKSGTKGNSLVVRVKCRALATYLEKTFGRRAENKHIPWEWLELEPRVLVPLIRGIWYGDGSNRNTEPYGRFSYSTTSCDLADFMEIAFLKLKVPFRRLTSRERTDKNGVHHRRAHYILGAENSTMNRLLPKLKVALAPETHRTSWFEGPNYVFPVKEAQVVKYEGTVHNLEIEESNSYVVGGATLHNCLPKDARALASLARTQKVDDAVISAALRFNDQQTSLAIRMAEELGGSIAGMKVSVLGLAFKEGTDDIRESTAIKLARALVESQAEVFVHDPEAMENARRVLDDTVHFSDTVEECLKDSHCCFIATGWLAYAKLRPRDFKALMARPIVVDGRRIFKQSPFRREGVLIATIGTGPSIVESG